MTADDTDATRQPAPALEVRSDAIGGDTVTAKWAALGDDLRRRIEQAARKWIGGGGA